MSSTPPLRQPWQFSLRTLFVVTALVAIVAAAGKWGGIAGAIAAVYVIALAGYLYHERWGVVVTLLLLGACAGLPFLVSAQPAARTVGRRNSCINNLKQIGLALHNYHDVFKAFPPAYIADKDGRPMHSWRTLLLPFIEEAGLYKRYNFNEPWDGPNNRKLASIDLSIFKCPDDVDPNRPVGMTNYVLVTGPGTMFDRDKSIALKDIKDGTAHTIMVVEVANSGIHWMEPRDLHINQMAPAINPKQGQGLSSRHTKHVACVLFADGHVKGLSDDTPPEKLRALLTPNGGEAIEGE